MGNKNNKKLEKTEKTNEKEEIDIIQNIKNEYKVIFLGEAGVGAKTNLIRRLMGEKFDEHSVATVISQIVRRHFPLKNNGEIVLEFRDTVGQEKFRTLNVDFYLKKIENDCIVLGYRIDNFNSFKEIKEYWYPKIKELNACKLIYLVGNAKDLESERRVSKEEAMKYAEEEGLRFFELSCKTDEGINEFIDDLVHNIVNQQ